MKKKGFSLMEMLVIVGIVGILALLGVYASQAFFENSKDKACRANLMVLKHALDFYMLDHEVFPAAIVQIPQKYFDRAYACVPRDDQSWQAKLSSLIESWKEAGLVYAQHFINTLSPNDMQLISCPKDNNPPSQNSADISYGLNVALAGMAITAYQALPPATQLIGDCQAATFAANAALTKRHGPAPGYALVIRKDGIIDEVPGP